MRKRGSAASQRMNLDSLVDIVSNNVGILVLLAVFMALFALIDPRTQSAPAAARQEPVPEKILVPWSHPTNKQHLFLSVQENRIQYFDMRQFFLELSKRNLTGPPTPVTIAQQGVEVRFFPVTNQVYCLEFRPSGGQGENWLEAQRAGSTWQRVLRDYPAERYVYYFWVSGDSFELFRQLRKSLWERQIEVGWKPALRKQPLEVCSGFEGSTTFEPQ
jgi:biopolymer transport protein ExbD